MKDKDAILLENSYQKILENLDNDFPGSDGGVSKHPEIESLCDQLKQAIKYGEVVAAENIIEKLQYFINKSK